TVEYRDGGGEVHGRHQVAARFTDFPMVVLVNRETTGGAELIAAVLQDNQRAVIAGQRTRGKASVQTVWRLTGVDRSLVLTVPAPELALKLTTGILIRPSRRNLNRFAESTPADVWGVYPDPGFESRVSPELSRQLAHWWQQQSLRPFADKGI